MNKYFVGIILVLVTVLALAIGLIVGLAPDKSDITNLQNSTSTRTILDHLQEVKSLIESSFSERVLAVDRIASAVHQSTSIAAIWPLCCDYENMTLTYDAIFGTTVDASTLCRQGPCTRDVNCQGGFLTSSFLEACQNNQNAVEELMWQYYGSEDNGHFHRFPSGSSTHNVDEHITMDTYDPRARPWYVLHYNTTGEEMQQVHISPPYFDEFSKVLMITGSKALYSENDGSLIGAVGVDMSLEYLLKPLSEMTLNAEHYTFIIEGATGDTVAHPKLTNDMLMDDKPIQYAQFENNTDFQALINSVGIGTKEHGNYENSSMKSACTAISPESSSLRYALCLVMHVGQ